MNISILVIALGAAATLICVGAAVVIVLVINKKK